LNQQKKSSTPM